ncbi:MAG: 23S rRNA (adenine(2503)-C(2))-methyltransferase RlmN [Chloroflexi bacterium]|nr:23S rRNA (adenine(2503)-C(2))-methyltransferase RlmN [Chloroflexota bacterium]
MTDLRRLLPAEMDELVTGAGFPRYRSDQLLHALWKEGKTSLSDIRVLPAALREHLAAQGYTIGATTETLRSASDDGETAKVLLKMADGTLIESVMMQYPEEGHHPRSTGCVSTQAGCAMGCVFCATGQMGFKRNLRAEEIVAQIMHFANLLRERGQHVTNVVFMGMGEPLANYAETIRAVRLLVDPRAFGLAQRSITISTVGVIRGIQRLAEEGLQVGLAISLHSPDDDLRRRLVPTAGPGSVGRIMEAAADYFHRTGRRVTFEYALLEGVNDSVETARELAALVAKTGAHVNLIPVNPTAGGFRRPARARTLAFERVLRENGVNCTVRVEKGSEIAAACGQLRTEAARAGALQATAQAAHRSTAAR